MEADEYEKEFARGELCRALPPRAVRCDAAPPTAAAPPRALRALACPLALAAAESGRVCKLEGLAANGELRTAR